MAVTVGEPYIIPITGRGPFEGNSRFNTGLQVDSRQYFMLIIMLTDCRAAQRRYAICVHFLSYAAR